MILASATDLHIVYIDFHILSIVLLIFFAEVGAFIWYYDIKVSKDYILAFKMEMKEVELDNGK